MPFNRPTRTELKEQASADIERHSDQKATGRGDVYFPLAQAVSSVAHGLHGHLQYNADQLFDDTADDENILRRAAEFDIRRIPARRATGTATATGDDGAQINAGELLQIGEVLYSVTEQATISSATATLKVDAIDAGAAGNINQGTLRFLEPVLGVDADVQVIEISGGAEIEPIARVRERLSERKKSPPMGGRDADYIAWARAAHVDVSRAWAYGNELGFGTMVVRIVTDFLATPVATETHINAVKNFTDTQRPAGMKRFDVYPVVPKSVNIPFTRLQPDSTVIRNAIIAELKDLFIREIEPGITLPLSRISEAISLATGEYDHRLALTEDITSQIGEFLVLGEVTWPAV